MIYFTIDKNGKRGHPTTKFKFIRKQLRNGTAKIISRTKDSLTVKFLDREFKGQLPPPKGGGLRRLKTT